MAGIIISIIPRLQFLLQLALQITLHAASENSASNPLMLHFQQLLATPFDIAASLHKLQLQLASRILSQDSSRRRIVETTTDILQLRL